MSSGDEDFSSHYIGVATDIDSSIDQCNNCYSVNWPSVEDNTIKLIAVAVNEYGKETQTSRTILVGSNDHPEVALDLDALPETIVEGEEITLIALARDSDGTIDSTRVEFLLDSDTNVIATGISAGIEDGWEKFEAQWTVPQAGSYLLGVRVYDDDNDSGTIFHEVSFDALLPPEAPTTISVKAVDGSGEYSLSSGDTFTGDYYTVSWNEMGAPSYRLQEVRDGNTNDAKWYETSGQSETIPNQSHGVYSYRVVACNAAGCSDELEPPQWSPEFTVDVVRVAPQAPAGLTAGSVHAGFDITRRTKLNWNSVTTSPKPRHYLVEEKTGGVDSPASWSEVARPLHSEDAGYSPTFTIPNRDPGIYSYRVNACNAETSCSSDGEIVTVEVVPPTLLGAESACDGQCLRVAGIGLDPGAAFTLTNLRNGDQLSIANNDLDWYPPQNNGPIEQQDPTTYVHIPLSAAMKSAFNEQDGLHISVAMPSGARAGIEVYGNPTVERLSQIDSAPTVGADGTVYVGSGSNVYALNPEDGSVKDGWPFATQDTVKATPLVDSVNGNIYVGSLDDYLYALTPYGLEQWRLQTGGDLVASPVLDENRILYQGSMDGAIYAVQAQNGAVQWTYPAGAGIAETPVLAGNGTLYFTTVGSARVYALGRGILGPDQLAWESSDSSLLKDSMEALDWQPRERHLPEYRMAARLYRMLLQPELSLSRDVLTFWTYALVNRAGIEEVAEAFLSSDTGKATFPPLQDDTAFVDALYERAFPGQEQPAFTHSGQLYTRNRLLDAMSGGASRAQIAVLFAQSVEYIAATSDLLFRSFEYMYVQDYSWAVFSCDEGDEYTRDCDEDGLPDYWEILYFGSDGVESGDSDADGDGVSNRDAFLAGIDPCAELCRRGVLNEPPAPEPAPTVEDWELNISAQTGSLPGEFRVSESGAASYRIPLSLPAGTAGVAPEISLNYSSQSGNGLLGHGWAIGGLSAISRCRQTLGQDGRARPITWSGEDRFCLDGQRLLVVEGEYGAPGSQYRTEVDSFALVELHGAITGEDSYFTVERKDGSISYYGRQLDSRRSVEKGAMSWSISTFEDSASNRIEFIYANDNSGHRIAEIRYAYTDVDSNRETGYKAGLLFDYEGRPDPIRGYTAGELLQTGKRLSAVRVRNDGGNGMWEVRRYELDYLNYPADRLSRLERIRQCVGSQCQSDTVFDWRLPVPGSFSASASDGLTLSQQDDRLAAGTRPVDINGDGRMDLIWLEPDWYDDGSGDIAFQTFKYVLAEESGFGQERTVYREPDNTSRPYEWQMIDYNADGRSDLITYLDDKKHWGVVLAQPDADGEWTLTGSPTPLPELTERYAKFADVNGDGLVDYLTHNHYRLLEPAGLPSSSSYYAFSEQKDVTLDIDWDLVDWENPMGGDVTQRTARMRHKAAPADFNGDGLVDPFVDLSMSAECVPPTSDPGRPCYYTGGVAITASQGLGEYRSYVYLGRVTTPEAADINGDGLPDVVYRKGAEGFYRINNGDGFGEPVALGEFPENRQYFDYDNDGDTDLVWHDHEAGRLKVRRWHSLDGDHGEFGEAESFRQTSGEENALHLFVDMNGDGVSDYVRVENDRAYLYPATDVRVPVNVVEKITNGLGAETEIAYGSLTHSGHYTRRDITATTEKRCSSARYGDTYPESNGANYLPWCRDFEVADLAEYYSYQNDPWEGDQQLGKPSPALELMGPMYLVTRVDSSAPTGTDPDAKSAISYYYAQAKIQAGGRGMLGFEKLTTVDEQTGVKTSTTYRQDFPYQGYPQSTEVRTKDGKLLSRSVNTWTLKNSDGEAWQESWRTAAMDSGSAELGPLQPRLAQSVEESFALNGADDTPIKTVTTVNEYDNYGNPTDIIVTTAQDNGDTFVTITGNTYGGSGDSVSFIRDQQALSTYAELGRLTHTVVEHNRTVAGVFEKETRTSSFDYYQTGAYAGLIEWEEIEPDSEFALTTRYTYDSYGNKKTATRESAGEASRSSEWRYENDQGRYLLWEKNAYQQKTREVIERNHLGLPVHVTDIAGVSAFMEYDAFGRKVLEYSETGAFSKTLLAAAGDRCPVGSVYQQTVTEAGGAESLACFDVLAREVRSGTRGFDGNWVFADTEYDKLGRTYRKSEPYRNSAQHWTVMDYDILGRVVGTDLPGTISFNGFIGDSGIAHDVHVDYSGYQTVTTNPNGHTKTERKNARGELVFVEDNLGGTLEYTYDAQGNLKTVTRTGDEGLLQSVTTMDYDKLGRKKSMKDPDKGDWYYGYNGFGELVWQIDAKRQLVINEYDMLGRQVRRTDYRHVAIEDPATLASNVNPQDFASVDDIEGDTYWTYNTDSAWQYPEGALAIPPGALEHVMDVESGYIKHHSYDRFGRVEITSIDQNMGETGDEYVQRTTYDGYGRVFQQFDAGGDGFSHSATENRYNDYGYLKAVVDGEAVNQASAENFYTVLAMDERGNVTRFQQGNGVVTERTYDPATGRLLGQTASIGSAFHVQKLTYQWDNLGNLDWRKDESGDKDLFEDFEYDGLNRLKSAQVTGRESQTIQYDGLGNIEYKSDVGDYYYADESECDNAAGPHAVCATSDGVQYRYDANGNMVEDSSRSLQYSTFDKPLWIKNTRNGHVTEFKYGPDRSRYLRIDTTSSGAVTETRYIGNVERISRPDGSEEVKRYLPGGAVVTISSGERESRYLHKDHLGSVDVITDASGSILQELSFDAWGQRRNALS
ncbi:PQQ-binding-like beta-propeller repeat protein [Microbulbifer elongatus]|uniref:SpvB/TcaC N-terminal domain-containing protein n=1 Tax=Microbulbifer elongatus TaxID=86173 RepID=UPI001E4408D9|nr:PQQ-binding-like beta-propeller repeat protein [Microbulbifer elongatus]